MNYTLITGACGGLGRSFVKLLVDSGDNLALVGTSEQKLKQLKSELQNDYNKIKIETFVCNLAQLSEREALIEKIKSKKIVINKLINNAGVIIEGDLLRFSDNEIINAIEVNCIGTLDLTKKIIENRDETQKLEILTVASQAAFQPIPHMAVYAATKSFLTSMMTALSVELKDKNIFITTICPSGMATTQAMKESIKSMGLKGKLTTLSTEKVAKVGLKALKKHKKIVIPGAINKIISFFSKFFSYSFLAKKTGKIWEKSQSKRNF